MAFLKREPLLRVKTLQGHGFSWHWKILKNGDYHARHKEKLKSVEKKLSATIIGETCRHNENEAPTLRKKYTTRGKRCSSAGISIETEKSRNEFSNRDESGHRHVLTNIMFWWRQQNDQQ